MAEPLESPGNDPGAAAQSALISVLTIVIVADRGLPDLYVPPGCRRR
jgi:hypothetical protein